jgi:hypothetical protein
MVAEDLSLSDKVVKNLADVPVYELVRPADIRVMHTRRLPYRPHEVIPGPPVPVQGFVFPGGEALPFP